jgi:hypothetical protein
MMGLNSGRPLPDLWRMFLHKNAEKKGGDGEAAHHKS